MGVAGVTWSSRLCLALTPCCVLAHQVSLALAEKLDLERFNEFKVQVRAILADVEDRLKDWSPVARGLKAPIDAVNGAGATSCLCCDSRVRSAKELQVRATAGPASGGRGAGCCRANRGGGGGSTNPIVPVSRSASTQCVSCTVCVLHSMCPSVTVGPWDSVLRVHRKTKCLGLQLFLPVACICTRCTVRWSSTSNNLRAASKQTAPTPSPPHHAHLTWRCMLHAGCCAEHGLQ